MTLQSKLGIVLERGLSNKNSMKAVVVGEHGIKYEFLFGKGSNTHGVIATKDDEVKFIETKKETWSIDDVLIPSILKSLELEEKVVDRKFRV